MIVAPADGTLRLVTQNDHAHFAAELLRLWRPLADHPRRDSLLRATREHDNGWHEADSAPRHRAENGRPHDFLSLPESLRRELWRRGVDREIDDPWAKLLILEHALTLHRDRDQDADWQPVFDHWREQRDTLLDPDAEPVGSADELAEDYHFLDLADLASLIVTCPWTRAFERHGVRLQGADDTLFVAPFPLAGSTRFDIPCRSIPDRSYRGDQDLAVELACARWESLTVRVAPFPQTDSTA